MKDSHKAKLKTLLYWGVIIGFVYAVSTHLTDLENVLEVLRKGNVFLIGIAVLLELLFVFFYSMTLRASIKLVGASPSKLDVFINLLSMFFMNIATPFGGWAGIIFFSKKTADSCDYPSTNITISSTVGQLLFNILFFAVILIAVVFLDFLGLRGMTVIFTALIGYFLMHFVLSILLYLAATKPIFSQKLVFAIKHQVGTLGGLISKPLLNFADDKIERWIYNVSLTMKMIIENIRNKGVVETFVYASISNLMYFTILYLIFLAFGVDVNFIQVFISHAIMYLFLVVSPTPNGIGFVEGIAQLVMSGIGIPKDAAVVVTLAFRGIIVWLPIFLGFFAFRHVGGNRSRRSAQLIN